MTTSLQTIEQLKTLTLGLSNSPLGDYQKVATMFEAIGDVIAILTQQNKEQQKLINEKLSLERQNKINESRYKTIFEYSPDAIFVMHKELYIDCNQKALEMFECIKKDILNVNPAKFSPVLQPNGKVSVDEVTKRTSAAVEGCPQNFKWQHLTKNNKPFDVLVRLNKIDMNGGSWFIANLHKIVERK